jgi:hypothetical protein
MSLPEQTDRPEPAPSEGDPSWHHNWDPEHELWEGCGRPDSDDDGCDWFIKKLDKG